MEECPGLSQLQNRRISLEVGQLHRPDLDSPGPLSLEDPLVSLDTMQQFPADLGRPGPSQSENPRDILSTENKRPTDLEDEGPSQLGSPDIRLDTEFTIRHKTPSPVIEQFPVRSPLSPIPSSSRTSNSRESARDDNYTGGFVVTPSQLKPLPQIVGKRSNLKRKSVD